MMPSGELNTFNGQGDAHKFFFSYENVIMKNKSNKEKADNLVTYQTGKASDFYFDNFTIYNAPTATAKDYLSTKSTHVGPLRTKKRYYHHDARCGYYEICWRKRKNVH